MSNTETSATTEATEVAATEPAPAESAVTEPAPAESAVTEPAPAESAVTVAFDLDALLTKVEPVATPANIRRTLVAYLGGLIDDAAYKKFRKDLVKKQNVAEDDLAAFDTYAASPQAEAAWLAFCDHAYNNVSQADACVKYSADPALLGTMVQANCLGLYVTDWKTWPKKGQLK